MNRPDEWERWQEDWSASPRTSDHAPDAADAIGLDATRPAASRFPARLELGLTAAVVAGILLSLTHTSTARDTAWAAVAVALIGAVWLVELLRRRGEADSLGQATPVYLDGARRLCRRVLRAVHVAWALGAIALLYLIPWWWEGRRFHAGEWISVTSLLALWLPAALLVTLAIQTWRMERAARRDLRRLDLLAQEFQDE